MKGSVIVGNPKAKSRTLDAGVLVATKLAGHPPELVVDLVDFGAKLLAWGDPDVTKTIAALREMDFIVVASPTFKATYTGLLKLFLDQIEPDGLAHIKCFPVMLGAGPAHALAPELLLKPVLVELGAICPAQGLYLIDKSFAEDPHLDTWIERVKPLL